MWLFLFTMYVFEKTRGICVGIKIKELSHKRWLFISIQLLVAVIVIVWEEMTAVVACSLEVSMVLFVRPFA